MQSTRRALLISQAFALLALGLPVTGAAAQTKEVTFAHQDSRRSVPREASTGTLFRSSQNYGPDDASGEPLAHVAFQWDDDMRHTLATRKRQSVGSWSVSAAATGSLAA